MNTYVSSNYSMSFLRACCIIFMLTISALAVMADEQTGEIVFGSSATILNAKSFSTDDTQARSWVLTIMASESEPFSQKAGYTQLGTSSSSITSFTATMTPTDDITITGFEVKFGGFTGTAGNVSLKIGGTELASGRLNGVNDVIISAGNLSIPALNKSLQVSLTGVAKGVKIYYIRYTCLTSETPQTPTLTSLSVTPSNRLTYTMGDALDLTGCVVTANYSDHSSVDVTSSCLFTPAEGTILTTIGNQTVTASYDGQTASFDVSVLPVILPINQSYSLTFTTGSNLYEISTNTSLSRILSDGVTYLSGVSSANNANFATIYGMRLGMSDAGGSIRFNLSDTTGCVFADSIVVCAKHCGKATTLQVNNSAAQTLTSDFKSYCFPIGGNITYVELTSGLYCWIESITVYYTIKSVSVTTNPAGYATFAPAYDVLMPLDPSVNVYFIATQNASSVTTTDARTVITDGYALAAGTGVIVKTTPNTEVIFPTSTITDNTCIRDKETLANLLTGVLTDTDCPDGNSYLFSYGSQGIGFYQWLKGTLSAGKAFLQLTPEMQAPQFVRFIIDGEDVVTSLDNIFSPTLHGADTQPCGESTTTSLPRYDLLGRPVSAGYKGIIISPNGKYLSK